MNKYSFCNIIQALLEESKLNKIESFKGKYRYWYIDKLEIYDKKMVNELKLYLNYHGYNKFFSFSIHNSSIPPYIKKHVVCLSSFGKVNKDYLTMLLKLKGYLI